MRACVQVAVFHGSKRAADAAGLEEADVVLTTYSVLENEHRKWVCVYLCVGLEEADVVLTTYSVLENEHRKWVCVCTFVWA